MIYLIILIYFILEYAIDFRNLKPIAASLLHFLVISITYCCIGVIMEIPGKAFVIIFAYAFSHIMIHHLIHLLRERARGDVPFGGCYTDGLFTGANQLLHLCLLIFTYRYIIRMMV